MRWQHTEFILKGIYLGLLVFVAMQKPTWEEMAYVGGCTLAGLVIFIGIAALRKLREGYRVKARLMAFLLFLLLENPGLVFSGVLLGLIAGASLVFYGPNTAQIPNQWDFAGCVGGGIALGVLFVLLRNVQKNTKRATPAKRGTANATMAGSAITSNTR